MTRRRFHRLIYVAGFVMHSWHNLRGFYTDRQHSFFWPEGRHSVSLRRSIVSCQQKWKHRLIALTFPPKNSPAASLVVTFEKPRSRCYYKTEKNHQITSLSCHRAMWRVLSNKQKLAATQINDPSLSLVVATHLYGELHPSLCNERSNRNLIPSYKNLRKRSVQ